MKYLPCINSNRKINSYRFYWRVENELFVLTWYRSVYWPHIDSMLRKLVRVKYTSAEYYLYEVLPFKNVRV